MRPSKIKPDVPVRIIITRIHPTSRTRPGGTAVEQYPAAMFVAMLSQCCRKCLGTAQHKQLQSECSISRHSPAPASDCLFTTIKPPTIPPPHIDRRRRQCRHLIKRTTNNNNCDRYKKTRTHTHTPSSISVVTATIAGALFQHKSLL